MLLAGIAEPQISFGRTRLTLTVSSGPRQMRGPFLTVMGSRQQRAKSQAGCRVKVKVLREERETAPYTTERAASNAAPAVSPGRPRAELAGSGGP